MHGWLSHVSPVKAFPKKIEFEQIANMKTTIQIALTALITVVACCCHDNAPKEITAALSDTAVAKRQIVSMLDSFNTAAARADFSGYFNYFADNATFLGTDATEHWDKQSFMVWSKPFFDRKRTWNFTSIDRHIYFGSNDDIAWFDELLNTQMKICRGSGVVIRQNNQWRVLQYVLSMTIPNSQADTVTKLKAVIEDPLIRKLSDR